MRQTGMAARGGYGGVSLSQRSAQRSQSMSFWEAELGDGRCRWPLNATSPIDAFRFCGKPVICGSYCEACFKLSRRGSEPKAEAA